MKLVVVFDEACETSVDGGPAVSSILSGIFVGTDETKSRAGCGDYSFIWGDSVDGPYIQGMRELGWPMELVGDSRYDRSLGGLDAGIPSELAPWSTVVAAGEAVPAEAPLTSVHCSLGPRGVVRGTFAHVSLGASAAAGHAWRGSAVERARRAIVTGCPGALARLHLDGPAPAPTQLTTVVEAVQSGSSRLPFLCRSMTIDRRRHQEVSGVTRMRSSAR